MGLFYYGDNLDILQRYVADASVDLVYLDPPFNSAQTEQPGRVSEVIQECFAFLGRNDTMAYLAMMAPRLVKLRRILNPIR